MEKRHEHKKKEEPSLEEKLHECESQKEEYLNGWKRARADLLNYQKEEQERTERLVEYAMEGVIERLLPVVDSFERAEGSIPDDRKADETMQGFLKIKSQLESFLESQGVTRIPSLGEEFNPEVHEVSEAVEAEEEKSGVIIEEIRAGYMIRDKLLRPARVKVVK